PGPSPVLVPDAAHDAAVDAVERDAGCRAARLHLWAARSEATAGGRIREIGRRAGNADQPHLGTVDRGEGREQALRVRVQRAVEEATGARKLGDLPGVHH